MEAPEPPTGQEAAESPHDHGDAGRRSARSRCRSPRARGSGRGRSRRCIRRDRLSRLGAAASRDAAARPGPLGAARLDRHAARRRAGRLRQRPRAQTPWIDRLAREGVRFDARARPQRRHAALAREPALGPATRSRTASATTAASASRRTRPTLATLLKARGYRTGGLRERVPARLALRPRRRLRR